MTFTLTSPSFHMGDEIPATFTCEGRNLSPELRWAGAPEGTQSFALIVADPDAPDPAHPQRTFTHWVLYDLPVTSVDLPQGVRPADLPNGTRQGLNDWQKVGYGGPCPPIGRHRYVHTLFALDTVLPDLGAAGRRDLLAAMEGHVLGQADLTGTYQKHQG